MSSPYPSNRTDPHQRSTAPGSTSPTAPKRVAVLVDEVAENEAAANPLAAPVQSTACIIEALKALGHDPVELALLPERTDEWLSQLISGDFHLAFNLCETVGGRSDAEHLTAAAVELLELPMTGAKSGTLLLCLDKDRCSAILRAHGIPVPDWKLIFAEDSAPFDWGRFPAIVKPVAEDASNGVHSSSVVRSSDQLPEAVERVQKAWGKALIQEFIEGREINLAIVGHHLLPPSEIDFSSLPEGSPPIVSFEAKWTTGSPEDLGTRPVCPAPLDPDRAEQLQRLAARAWKLMDGSGYARVDVRLTRTGQPYIIDVNPNPDLSPDAGIARQALSAGWTYDDLIAQIVASSFPSQNGEGAKDWVFMPPLDTNGRAH